MIAAASTTSDPASAGSTDGNIFAIMITRDDPTTMGRLIRIDQSGREQRRSPIETVHVRTVTFIGGKILAIAGEVKGNGAVRLIEINQGNLEMAKQGDDDIKIGSLLWVNGHDLYAIATDHNTNDCFIGRFDMNLTLQAKSTETVHPSAGVTIQQGRLLTQGKDGAALILNPSTLVKQ
jgi:hypothetical protein